MTQSNGDLLQEIPTSFIEAIESIGLAVFRAQIFPHPKIEYISPTIESLTGYAQYAWLADPGLPTRCIDPDDWHLLLSLLTRRPIVNNDHQRVRFLRSDGTWAILEIGIKGIPSQDGAIHTVQGVIWETPPPEKLQMESDEYRILLSNIIETAIDAVIILDSDLNIYIFNPAAEEMFKCTAAEAQGKPLDRFLPPGLGPWHAEQMRAMTSAGQPSRRMGRTRVTSGVRSTGEAFPVEASISSFEYNGKAFFTALLRDNTDRKRAEDDLRYLSTHDTLTGLYNRFFFEVELQRLERSRSNQVGIVIADVDGLKYINDTLGHTVGDQLLRGVASAIQSAFRSEDVVARLGGDEFGVLLPFSDNETIAKAVQRVYENVYRMKLEKPELHFGLSVGYATANDLELLSETIKRADTAMYAQKNRRTSPPRSPI